MILLTTFSSVEERVSVGIILKSQLTTPHPCKATIVLTFEKFGIRQCDGGGESVRREHSQKSAVYSFCSVNLVSS